MTLDDTTLLQMWMSPLTVVSPSEVTRLTQRPQTPEALAAAVYDYAELCWQRGRRFEQARARDARTRHLWTWPWTRRPS